MTGRGALWVVAGYLVGTLPSAWLVARLTGADRVIAESKRERGEADAHIVLGRRLGPGWATVATVADVATALGLVLLARHVGGLSSEWLALSGVAVVMGHAFPFYLRHMSGRGLAAAAGVFLTLIPLPMIVGGLTMCAGFLVRRSGLFSTIGFASVPVAAWLQGQPPPFVAMAAAVFLLILVRRLEGIAASARELGIGWGAAARARVLYDASRPPGGSGARGPVSGDAPGSRR